MIKKAHDVLSDTLHTTLYKVAQTLDFKLPSYVEQGIPLEKEAAIRVSDTLFADETNRMFPLTDKANTWLSGAYFAKTAAESYSAPEYTRIASKIIKAAELYGICDDVCDVMEKISQEEISATASQIEKEAELATSCYGEPETGAFPMFTEGQTKKAFDYFSENAYAYDWQRRAKIAKNILTKAGEYGLTAPDCIRKEAGIGFPRVDFLAENLLTREAELERKGLHKLAEDMRKTIKVVIEASPEDLLDKLEALREMISGMDELSGIDADYGRRFLPPADFIFDIDDTEAQTFKEDTIPMCGELFSAKALSNLPKQLFKRIMPESMVSDMCGEEGSLCPRKMSITIVKMAPRDQHNLLDVIRDFTSGAGAPMIEPEDIETDNEQEDKEDSKKPDSTHK